MSEYYKTFVRTNFVGNLSNSSDNENYSIFKKVSPKFSEQFELENFIKKLSKLEQFDLHIKNLCVEDKDNIDLILLLRCKISHAIKGCISRMCNKVNIEDKKLTLRALANEVLEDDGDRYLTSIISKKYQELFELVESGKPIYEGLSDQEKKIFDGLLGELENIDNAKGEIVASKLKNKKNIRKIIKNNNGVTFIKKPFNLKTIEGLYEKSLIQEKNNSKFEKGRLYPFSANIILSYRGTNGASISTWANYLVERYKGITKITRPIGYTRITGLALLNDKSFSQVERAFKKYGYIKNDYFDDSIAKISKNKKEKVIINFIEKVFNLFKVNYLIEKDNYRKIYKRDVGWVPNDDFWEAITPKISNLHIKINPEITKQIITQMILSLKKYSEEKYKYEETEEDPISVERNNELLEFIKNLVINVAYSQVKSVIDEDMKDWHNEEDSKFKKAWILFSEKREFSEISSLTGIGKPSLSKRFKFQIIAGKTANFVIEILKEIIYCKKNNLKSFINEFNKKYNLDTELDEDIINIFKRYLLLNKTSSRTVFDNDEKFDEILETISKFINPKKGIKNVLSDIVRDIINKKSI